MQQAIYTNTHTVKSSVIHGHGTGIFLESHEDQPRKGQPRKGQPRKGQPRKGQSRIGQPSEDQFQVQRFRKLRLTLSVLGNVLGGAVLLSGMLMLPQLVVGLLAG